MFRRYTQLLSGLLAYGIAIAMIVRGEIGIAPWDVLAQGISFKTNLDFGLITVLIGAVVLLLWIPLREKPGIGTVLNVLLVGPAASLGLFLIPPGLDLWVRILLFAGGIVLMGLATGLYIGARFGTGPRDGLMTGVSRRTGWRIWIVRSGIELVVLGIGWLLGGDVGVGTLLFALLIGPSCNFFMPRLHIPLPADARVPTGDTEPIATIDSPAR